MTKKGSALMISLWILAILVVFALGLGHRAVINLKLAKYQKDRLKATCLAKAGINRAIAELKKDDRNYDTPNDSWSTGKDADGNNIFENIEIITDSNEKFTVHITDEERKININKVSTDTDKQILTSLLEHIGVEDVEKLKTSIVEWISDSKESEEEKRVFKNASLKTPEECLLILEYFYEMNGKDKKEAQEISRQIYDKLKDLITISANALNVNTAPNDTLTILANGVAKDEEKDCVPAVVNEIIKQREGKDYFKSINEIKINDDLVAGTSSDFNLFNNLINHLNVSSNYFKIVSQGKAGNVTKNITAIYDRWAQTIIYWHEN